MKNQALLNRLREEILQHIESRKSLMLASLDKDGIPYASYAPFAHVENHLYVLLSDIAIHAKNLTSNPDASVLIIEDEDSANQLFARKRVNYRIRAEYIAETSEHWQTGIKALAGRHGERINQLSQLQDFHLFRLTPKGGRYVKGFGKAYHLQGEQLAGAVLNHLTEGHKRKENTAVAF